ncbi:MAG: flagellar basal body protein [Candidatus Melainabacteria bacterium]|nr:MAG: flagellar basal body protein [Candidatus Melainabacteria bacterium]
MAQAFFTSMGGINAAQSQINVIANNVANINTMGFKSSNMTFEDIYYITHSSGSAPTKTLGGTNPSSSWSGSSSECHKQKFHSGNYNNNREKHRYKYSRKWLLLRAKR